VIDWYFLPTLINFLPTKKLIKVAVEETKRPIEICSNGLGWKSRSKAEKIIAKEAKKIKIPSAMLEKYSAFE